MSAINIRIGSDKSLTVPTNMVAEFYVFELGFAGVLLSVDGECVARIRRGASQGVGPFVVGPGSKVTAEQGSVGLSGWLRPIEGCKGEPTRAADKLL